MSHQQVVEAAVNAAASRGVETTVIVLGGGNGMAPSMAAQDHAMAGVPLPSYTDSEVASKLMAAEKALAELTAQLSQRDQTITQLQQSAAAQVPTGASEQPTETVSIDAYGIEVLGIPEDIASKVSKVYATVGALREAASSGKLKEMKLKGGQKAVIDIQERLLGRVPPERIPASAAPAAAATGDSATPAGHSDRPWMDRLGAVKAKERDMAEWAAKLAALRQQFPVETEMPDEEYDKLLDARHEHDIAKSQVVALVWGLGLDKEHLRGDNGSVDACLVAAGLTHLTDNPQPRVAPGA